MLKHRRGPPRPKNTISYSLRTDVQSEVILEEDLRSSYQSKPTKSASATTTTASKPVDDPPLVRLSRSKKLLDLIHRRNKNQHRNQRFFKWINLLRRSLTQLIALHLELTRLDASQSSTNTSTSTNITRKAASTAIPSAHDVRRRFERQADIRSQLEVHQEWMRETLVPGAYVGFSSLVADSQFANLGVVLVGVLAEISSAVGPCRRIDKIPRVARSTMAGAKAGTAGGGTGEARSVRGISTLVTGPDHGEIVERLYDSGDGGEMAMKMDLDVGEDTGEVVQRDSNPATFTRTITEPGTTAKAKGISSSKAGRSEHDLHRSASKHNPTKDIDSNTLRLLSPFPPEQASTSESKTPSKTKANSDSSSRPKSDIHNSNNSTDLTPRPPTIYKPEADTSAKSKDDKTKEKKTKKKKSKARNAIDDLFSGFG